jgi:hypothetical protein
VYEKEMRKIHEERNKTKNNLSNGNVDQEKINAWS